MNDKPDYEKALEKALGRGSNDDIPEVVHAVAQNRLKTLRNEFSEAAKSIHFSPFPQLEPGEQVLCMRGFVRALRVKSLPTLRWFFSLPPLLDAGLYVTNRRVLLRAGILRLMNHEFSQWYPDAFPGPTETICDVNLGRSLVWGQYLEVVSETNEPVLLRSRQMRLRYYIHSPEAVRDAIPFPRRT
jgi:hypothetical protein